jgi:hypothetical protein
VPDLEAGRALFLAYGGSTYGMWRNGEIDQYRSYGVPAEVEAGWLAEITVERLRQLGGAGSWSVVWFLTSHADLTHLPEVVAVRPPGELWERISYEETLLAYLDAIARPAAGPRPPHSSPEELAAALGRVIDVASELRRRARGERNRARIDAVAEGAALRLDAARRSPYGRWTWKAPPPEARPVF